MTTVRRLPMLIKQMLMEMQLGMHVTIVETLGKCWRNVPIMFLLLVCESREDSYLIS